MKLGYVPIDHDGEAVSKTVEYAFDDWTIAEMARSMEIQDVAETFAKRAGNWRNVFRTPKLDLRDLGTQTGPSVNPSIQRVQEREVDLQKGTPGNTPGINRTMNVD